MSSRLIPRACRGKRALLLAGVTVAGPLVAGCGSSSSPQQFRGVSGPGFRFSAPTGWRITHGSGRVSAEHGADLVQVVTFKLVRPYRDSLFGAVENELKLRMQ